MLLWLTLWPLWCALLLAPAIMMSPGCGCCDTVTCEPCRTFGGGAAEFVTVTLSHIGDKRCEDCGDVWNGTFVLSFIGDLSGVMWIGAGCGWMAGVNDFCGKSDVRLYFYLDEDGTLAHVHAVYGPVNSLIFHFTELLSRFDFTNCALFSGSMDEPVLGAETGYLPWCAATDYNGVGATAEVATV